MYAIIQGQRIINPSAWQLTDEYQEIDFDYNEFISKDEGYYIYENNKVKVNPNYEEEKKEQEEREFNQKFFHTSLGYVSRDVHMKNGTVKDFLTDILPLLKVGIPVLIYTRELVQSKVPATQQFIDECKQQVLIDFYGENTIEN